MSTNAATDLTPLENRTMSANAATDLTPLENRTMSANAATDLTFPGSLDELVQRFIEAKRVEDLVIKYCVEIEARILALAPAAEEGSTTTTLDCGFKLTTTGKLGYSLDDPDALREITRAWDSALVPLKTTTVLDATGCKYLRRERPDLWQQIARVITVKPAKTSVKVGV